MSINLEVNRWRKLKRNDLTSSLTGEKRENNQERDLQFKSGTGRKSGLERKYNS